MKNNKGMTIVEIIVSITLISIILVFLINLLITIKNANDKSKSASELLINQAVITKTIQSDFINYKLKGVAVCSEDDVSDQAIVPRNNETADYNMNIYCLKFNYENTNEKGYLLQYKYIYNNNDLEKNIIGYKRGTYQVMRETPILNNESEGEVTTSCKSNNNRGKNCSLRIVMPVIGTDANNYDIELTYIYKYDDFSYEVGNNYKFNIINE